jgi:NTP pyrophosphatase (non-canonical NTP hydrolase)
LYQEILKTIKNKKMKVKHILASKLDKKPTISNSQVKEHLDPNATSLILHYIDYDFKLSFHKSRNGNTWYCDNTFPNESFLPKIGLPKFYEVEIVSSGEDLTFSFQNEFQQIRNWANERGIYQKGDPKTQYIKLQEEAGELAKAILKNDDFEFVDAIGDCVVVLTNLAALKGIKIEDCINSAYDVISKRKGKMENGTFVKEQ